MELSQDLNANIEKRDDELEKAIEYLIKLETPCKIFYDTVGFNYYVFIGKAIFFSYKYDINFEIFLNKNFEGFISNLLEYLFKIRYQLVFNVKIDPHKAQKACDLNDKHVIGLSNALYITNYISTRVPSEFYAKFLVNNGLKVFLGFMSDEKFVQINYNSEICSLSGDSELFDQITLTIATICKKTCDNFRKLWSDLNCVNVLFTTVKIKESIWFFAYLVISYIIDDKQIENFEEIHTILYRLTKLLLKFKHEFNAYSFKKVKREILFNGKVINCELRCVRDGNLWPGIDELISCLYKLSVNQKLKNELYFVYDLKNFLKTFIKKGNYIEINFTLQLLAQLSFSPTISEDLINDIELNTILSDFLLKNLNEIKDKNENFIYLSIKNLIHKINWNLDQIQPSQLLNTTNKSSNILISYKKNKEFCLKLKEKLEVSGFNVFLNENEVLTLDEITKPVENSSCILICVTDQYRQSINCQIQANYAFKLNRKVIPLIIQNDVHGWLDVLKDKKTTIDFSYFSYDECFRKLLIELRKI